MKIDQKKSSKQESAVLIALINKKQTADQSKEYLDELTFLAETLGAKTIKTFTQKLDPPDVRTFVGKGKLDEIKTHIRAMNIDWAIFDDDLSPSQLRNLEKVLKCRIFDRSLLILEIFLKRAQTAQAKTQVELARYQYLMPRLTHMWTHLERQRGGTGTRGGAGEKEIETDRRIIRNQISVLKGKLKKIDKQRETQRKGRRGIVRVALVGYTNVGKSTLMTVLSKTQVYAEDKLFATVDSTVRKVVIKNIPFLLSDTVGFIRKLPHHLIESFKSTLDEVTESDVLLHVVDISHPNYSEQIEVVNKTLADLGASEKQMIYVYNKMDQLIEFRVAHEEECTRDLITDFYLNKKEKSAVYISAKTSMNIDRLKKLIFNKVSKRHYMIYPNFLKNESY